MKMKESSLNDLDICYQSHNSEWLWTSFNRQSLTKLKFWQIFIIIYFIKYTMIVMKIESSIQKLIKQLFTRLFSLDFVMNNITDKWKQTDKIIILLLLIFMLIALFSWPSLYTGIVLFRIVKWTDFTRSEPIHLSYDLMNLMNDLKDFKQRKGCGMNLALPGKWNGVSR